MKKCYRFLPFVIVSALLTVLPYSSYAQTVYEGQVLEEITELPMPAATVTLSKQHISVKANEQGYFRIVTANAIVDDILVFTYTGYETYRFPIKNYKDYLFIKMKPNARTLNEVNIKAGKLTKLTLDRFTFADILEDPRFTSKFILIKKHKFSAKLFNVPVDHAKLLKVQLGRRDFSGDHIKINKFAKFILHIMDVSDKNGAPGKILLSKDVTLQDNSRVISIDFSKDNLILPAKFFVAVETLFIPFNEVISIVSEEKVTGVNKKGDQILERAPLYSISYQPFIAGISDKRLRHLGLRIKMESGYPSKVIPWRPSLLQYFIDVTMKLYFTFLSCLITVFANAQEQKLNKICIVDMVTHEPLTVSVAILKAKLSITTEDDGIFIIPGDLKTMTDTVIFSVQNYDQLKMPLKALHGLDTIRLSKAIVEQSGVLPSFSKETLLNDFKDKDIGHYVGIHDKASSFNYLQIAQRFNTDTVNTQLNSIQINRLSFHMNSTYGSSSSDVLRDLSDIEYTNFRIRVYDLDSTTGKPGRDLSKNIIEIKIRDSEKARIDLKKFNIAIPNKVFFVAIEWMRDYANAHYTIVFTYDLASNKKVISYKPAIGISPITNSQLNIWALDTNHKWIPYDTFSPFGTDLAIKATIGYN